MNKVINPTPLGGGGGGLVPTIRATAPVGSTVTCDGQTKVVGAEGFVDFVVSAEPVNILPDGVQGLESIEATGTGGASGQIIKTGIVTSTTDVIKIKTRVKFDTIPSAEEYLIGNYYSGGVCAIRLYNKNWYGQTSSYIPATTDWTEIDYEQGSSVTTILSVNGQIVTSSATSCGTLELILFDSGLSVTRRIGIKSQDWLMYKNGNLVRRFIPAIYNSQVGMWDTVSNAFFGNQGTGSFIAGEPKEWTDYPTYTVTATLDGKTSTKEVTVDKVGLFPVEMDYKLWLYRYGDECESVTGGWISGGDSQATKTKNIDNLYLYWGGSTNIYHGWFTTATTIDITNYSYLCVEWQCSNIYRSGSSYDANVYLGNALDTADVHAQSKVALERTISRIPFNITGSKKAFITEYGAQMNVYAVWLE